MNTNPFPPSTCRESQNSELRASLLAAVTRARVAQHDESLGPGHDGEYHGGSRAIRRRGGVRAAGTRTRVAPRGAQIRHPGQTRVRDLPRNLRRRTHSTKYNSPKLLGKTNQKSISVVSPSCMQTCAKKEERGRIKEWSWKTGWVGECFQATSRSHGSVGHGSVEKKLGLVHTVRSCLSKPFPPFPSPLSLPLGLDGSVVASTAATEPPVDPGAYSRIDWFVHAPEKKN